ncbi:MAG TPA: ADOP family duplicated permease [Thermoanaerobaculia bacterium]
MNASTQELRLALRRLAKSPGFTFAAVASLAIGIGATTAIYSIVQTLLLRPMSGIAQPERLVDIGRVQGGAGFDTFGYPDLVEVRDEVQSLDRVFGFQFEPHHVRVGDASRRVLGFAVSGSYFEALGVGAAHGRPLRPDDDSDQGGAAVAVVSHAFFERELGGELSRIGAEIRVDGHPFTLVGVAPADFSGHIFPLRPDLFLPLTTPMGDEPWQTERLRSREASWFHMGGRLAPGATLATARTEVDALAARVAAAHPETHAERGIALLPAKATPGIARTPLRLFSTLLFTLVGLVLAIACMNVASMLLARAEERGRELAVRQALGASRRRLVQELLSETLLLFLLAAAPALLLARWSVDLIAAFRPPTPIPVFLDFPVDWSAAAFAAALALATGLLFGLAPALRATRRAPNAALHDGIAGGGTRQLRLRRGLVGAQLALSLVLLVAAGLLLRALDTARSINPGFRTDGVVGYSLSFELTGRSDEGARQLLADLMTEAGALPWATAVTASATLPLDLSRIGIGGVEIDGRESPSRFGLETDANIVAPGYFTTLGIPLEGREFEASDHFDGARVAIVNQTFAARYFPEGALGRTFRLVGDDEPPTYRIVGLARDIKASSLGEPARPFLWVAASQWHARDYYLLVRGADVATMTRDLTALVRRLEPDLPPGPPSPLVEVAATSTLPQRLAASVAGAVGAVGLFLAAIGLYGVVAFAVAARRRELAVRMALGARGQDVVRFVLADAARPVALGIVVGLVLAFALSRLLSSLLFGLSATDLVTFAGVPALLVAVAAVAVLIPARRAAAIEPAAALRSE